MPIPAVSGDNERLGPKRAARPHARHLAHGQCDAGELRRAGRAQRAREQRLVVRREIQPLRAIVHVEPVHDARSAQVAAAARSARCRIWDAVSPAPGRPDQPVVFRVLAHAHAAEDRELDIDKLQALRRVLGLDPPRADVTGGRQDDRAPRQEIAVVRHAPIPQEDRRSLRVFRDAMPLKANRVAGHGLHFLARRVEVAQRQEPRARALQRGPRG